MDIKNGMVVLSTAESVYAGAPGQPLPERFATSHAGKYLPTAADALNGHEAIASDPGASAMDRLAADRKARLVQPVVEGLTALVVA